MEILEGRKKVYAVVINTDGTEGRGADYAKHFCELKPTAERLANRADVQGTNGEVVELELIKVSAPELRFSSLWWGPVQIVLPTPEDHALQRAIDIAIERQREIDKVIAKALALGLSEEDVALLRP